MGSEKQLKSEIKRLKLEIKKLKEEEDKKINLIFETIVSALKAPKTILENPTTIERIFKRIASEKRKELKLKVNFFQEKISHFQQIAQEIPQRDKLLSAELSQDIRNRLMSLGGFSKRFPKLTRNIDRVSNSVSELDNHLKEIKKYLRVICEEAKLTEETLNNRWNRKRRGTKKRQKQEKG